VESMSKTIDSFFTPTSKPTKRQRFGSTPEEVTSHDDMEPELTGHLPTREQLITDLGKLLDEKLSNLVTKQDISILMSQVQELKQENEALKIEVRNCKLREEKIMERLVDLESRSRRNNLIFRGLNVPDQTRDYRQVIAKFCDETFSMDRNVWVNRAHPLDKAKNAIIAHFPEDTHIDFIMSKVRTLRGTGVSVHRDFPREVREKRAKLTAVRSEVERVAGRRRMPIVYDHMYIDGTRFTWESDGLKAGEVAGAVKLRQLFHHNFDEFLAKLECEAGRRQERSGPTYAEIANSRASTQPPDRGASSQAAVTEGTEASG
jgi:regulator of replication initiation timing